MSEALLELQSQGKYQVFFDFSGHVDGFDLKIYKGRWRPKKKPILKMMLRMDRPEPFDIHTLSTIRFAEIIAQIKSLK